MDSMLSRCSHIAPTNHTFTEISKKRGHKAKPRSRLPLHAPTRKAAMQSHDAALRSGQRAEGGAQGMEGAIFVVDEPQGHVRRFAA